MVDNPAFVRIERPLYDQEKLHTDFSYEKRKSNWINSTCECRSKWKLKNAVRSMFPIVSWLGHYKWKKDLSCDVIAGFTVAIMHIPQGIAYALLGNVPPIVGIYMAFFPVLIYAFMGTSKHNSMGTFAVVCLMSGKVVLEHSDSSYFMDDPGGNLTAPLLDNDTPKYSPIQVATALSFVVAIFQFIMYIFRLGIVSALLSETLVSGFTTGAAIHVVTSQLKDIFGVTIPKFKGFGTTIKTVYSIIMELPNCNPVALIVSSIAVTVLVVNNELIKPKIAKLCQFPIPIELCVIVIGTMVSYFYDLNEEYALNTIGEIPKGIPDPFVPPLELIPSMLLDGLTIAIVSYTISLSMGLIFAQKLSYELDANQELLAQGAGNLFGSFFSCLPFTASLSRSLIQQNVGGKTQLTSIVSCVILLFVLMWVGPFFEPLPKSILASLILVALKGMLMQIQDFFKFLRLSKLDAAVWMITFLSVAFISIDLGLLIGVILSLLSILMLGLKPYTCLLGPVPHTDLYLDIRRYKGVRELRGIKIFHYQGGINFASRTFFKSELYEQISLNPQKELVWRKKLAKLAELNDSIIIGLDKKQKSKQDKLERKINTYLRCLILDFSALSYVDPSGVSMLKILAEEFKRIDIPIYIGGCSEPVYETMTKCDLLDAHKNLYRIFPNVHDAVQFAVTIFQDIPDVNLECLPIISRL